MTSSARYLVVSLHDVHEGSLSLIQEQVRFCEELGVASLSLLVVPNYHQQGQWNHSQILVDWLKKRQEKGDEIVLHGYYHQRVNQATSYRNWFWTQFYTQNEAEFLDLNETEAKQRIDLGLQTFLSEDLLTSGFIAPAWLMSDDTLKTIFKMGFHYTNTLTHLFINPILLQRGSTQIASQSLCYSSRAAWRRISSLIWNRILFHRVSTQSFIRLSLHPQDLTFTSFRKQIQFFLKEMLDQGVIPISYDKWVKQEIMIHG